MAGAPRSAGRTGAMLIAVLAALSLQATDATLAELERAYDQTCNSRIYGQFDDLCSDMADRVRAYKRELKRRPRAGASPPSAPAPAPATATPSPVPPLTPLPSGEPLAPAPPKR